MSIEAVDVTQVLQDISALNHLLEQEFDSLKQRHLDQLDEFEAEKTDLLKRLEPLTPFFVQAEMLSEPWVTAREQLRQCRDKHFRNLQLLRRQLDAVQGALQALLGDRVSDNDVYTRRGQIGPTRFQRTYAPV